MRILHIVDNLAVSSGVSSVVMNLYRNINREIIQFDFLVMKHHKTSYEVEILDMGGKIYHVDSPLALNTIYSSVKQSKKFFKKNAKLYDIVHLHSPTTVNFNLRFAKKFNIRNRIIHSHSTMFSNNKIKKIINSILCLNIKQYANKYWACSKKAGEFLYGDNKQVELINNAIDCEKHKFNNSIRCDYRKKIGAEGKYVIGHVARFNEIKNQRFLINAFCEACKNDGKLILVLVGDGITQEESMELVKSKGVEDKVIFLGFRTDVNNLMSSFDLLVLPSLKEGLPVVAVEAQASGLPCYLSSTITREVDLGNVEYFDLNIETWKNAFKRKTNNKNRDLFYDSIIASRFNIKKEAKRVQDMYVEMNLEREKS